MKESMFNRYFITDDGVKLAFNSFSCGLAIVDEQYDYIINNICNINENNIPVGYEECYHNAVEGRFIVPEDFDELLDLSTKRNLQKYDTSTLGLTIAPTLSCNFKCVYCYESSKPGIMNDDVCSSLINFVINQSSHLKKLDISWYGGEPLLAINVIYKLSEAFLSICSDNNIEYHAYMISNGSLLNDEIISNLIKYKVEGIQITIDGPPEIHNKRRVNKKGTDTFELLINNINKILMTNKMEVVIRINIDKSNSEQLDLLLSLLAEKLISKSVRISFGQVTAYTEACKSIENSCYDNAAFAMELLGYYDILKKYGFSEYTKLPYPEPKLNYCCAEFLNSFVVDHEGYMYKCWNEVGCIPSAVGNILDGKFDISNYKNGLWLHRNVLGNEKCKTCSLLPICMGGCPHNDIVLKKNAVCDLIQYNIQETVLNYYVMLTGGGIS